MDSNKISATLYVLAGIAFLVSAGIGGNILFIGLGVYFIAVGARRFRNQS